MRTIHKHFALTFLALATTAAFQFAEAAELKPGDVINAANLDKVKNDTFEGHSIASLVTEKMEFMIKNYKLTIKLRHSEEIPANQRDVEATRKYAGEVKFDPQTNEVMGYKAGLPFPNIGMEDPKAGYKLLYNFYYTGTTGYSFDGAFALLFIDQEKGLDRVQTSYTASFKMKNRPDPKPVEGDGTIINKQLLFVTAPFDVKGVGIFSVRYDSPRFEDNWAYIKSVRRTRQLSGGSWMDNMLGGVQLNDEYDGLAARPSWFPEVKLLGTRWVLAVAHLKLPIADASKKGTPEEFPAVDLKNKPHWNPIADWEPREVYVIQVAMPKEHPYSKRVYYMETKFPRIYMMEHYDKSDQFVKFSQVLSTPTKGGDGYIGMLPWQGHTYDIKRKEAFVYIAYPGTVINRSGLKPEDVSLGKMEATAK
ncbi:MAG: DUF1329 domain-containing protein [Betaproteobacteria bacterium]|nr:DUF1329 domain-containing protein [Betaproteobacteria bacterium]